MTDAELFKCFQSLSQSWHALVSRLSPREQLALKFGLHASHAEEALVTGDIRRAEAHFLSMQQISRQL